MILVHNSEQFLSHMKRNVFYVRTVGWMDGMEEAFRILLHKIMKCHKQLSLQYSYYFKNHKQLSLLLLFLKCVIFN